MENIAMYCANCGSEIVENTKFCDKCGNKINQFLMNTI